MNGFIAPLANTSRAYGAQKSKPPTEKAEAAKEAAASDGGGKVTMEEERVV